MSVDCQQKALSFDTTLSKLPQTEAKHLILQMPIFCVILPSVVNKTLRYLTHPNPECSFYRFLFENHGLGLGGHDSFIKNTCIFKVNKLSFKVECLWTLDFKLLISVPYILSSVQSSWIFLGILMHCCLQLKLTFLRVLMCF